MRPIPGLHPRESIIRATERRPSRLLNEFLPALFTASRARDNVHRGTVIRVGLGAASVGNFKVVHGPESLVAVLVRPELQVDLVLEEEFLQAEPVEERQAHADQGLVVGAVVGVGIAAVHGSVAEGDDPGSFGSVKGSQCDLVFVVFRWDIDE